VAFAGFLISLALQRQEMTYQKEQLELQREDLQNQTKQLALQTTELEAQKEEMKRTREEMELQRNESNLFSLLDAHKRLIDSLTCTPQALNEEDRILGDAFFRRAGKEVAAIYELKGSHLLDYVVRETERIAEKRREALETQRAEHFSYLLGGSNDAARIFLLASGIDESDRLITDFIREKLGSRATFYQRIYWNSLSQNERVLRDLRNSELDSPGLPLLKLSFQGIRLGKQGHPVSDAFIVLEAPNDTSFVDQQKLSTPPAPTMFSPFIGWEPFRAMVNNKIQLLAYSHSLAEKVLGEGKKNGIILQHSFSQAWDITLVVNRMGLLYSLKMHLSVSFSRKRDEGLFLFVDGV
jgi:hypothetical protein